MFLTVACPIIATAVSDSTLEYDAIEVGSGYVEACCDLGDGDVGGFEQSADGLALFGGQLRGAAAFAVASAGDRLHLAYQKTSS